VPVRIEAGPEVIAPREAEAGEEVEGLPAHGLDAVDDRTGIGLRVLQRAVQVVDHRQPALGDLGLRSFPGLAHLPGAPLAHVVEFGQRAQPLVLKLGDAGGRAVVPGSGALVDRLGLNRLGLDGLGLDGLGLDGLVRALAPLTHGW
jgi:hypothetical protein